MVGFFFLGSGWGVLMSILHSWCTNGGKQFTPTLGKKTLAGVILHFGKSIYTSLVYEWIGGKQFTPTLGKKKHFLVYKNNFPGINLHQIKVKLTSF
jgi:hypothetical protein